MLCERMKQMPKLALPKMNLYYKRKMKRKKGIDPTDCPFCGHLVIFNRFVEIINVNFFYIDGK